MHRLGWKAQLFKSDDASMLGHGHGVSQLCYHVYMWEFI